MDMSVPIPSECENKRSTWKVNGHFCYTIKFECENTFEEENPASSSMGDRSWAIPIEINTPCVEAIIL